MTTREIECQTALGKCGFPGGGLAINPYAGCGHACAFCYARFIKRFTGHQEEWGTFVDARTNIADVLAKQMKNPKLRGQRIFLGTVTDPYQPLERKYKLARKILGVLKNYSNPVSILTKSSLVLRDVQLLKRLKNVDVNFTLTTLDRKWQRLTEPFSSTAEQRLKAARQLNQKGVAVLAMMGPYWPYFTDAPSLFKKFKEAGIKRVFTESFNSVGGNWTDVEKILKTSYPQLLKPMKEIFFEPKKFGEFYRNEKKKIEQLSKAYNIPVTVYFGRGHAAKFR